MRSHLDDAGRHALRPLASIGGPVAVVAPHPDDESLACGGLIAGLAGAGVAVRVIVVTDGSGSHPGSAGYPPERLRTLREAETLDAAAALGLAPDAVTFLRLPDGETARLPTAARASAVAALTDAIGDAATVVAPWDGDPHPDHIATAHLTAAACHGLEVRRIAYPVWAWVRGDERPTAGTPWRLDVTEGLPCKRAAIAAHRSQTTPLIDDIPDGFVLAPDVLAHFDRDWELYWDL